MPRPTKITVASRERNRIHAQKTRQRKKEHVQVLQTRAEDLKEEQIRLKQTITEKTTANILVRLLPVTTKGSSKGDTNVDDVCRDDPLVEELLLRPVASIPDSSKIPELPALILTGQQALRKMKANAQVDAAPTPSSDAALQPPLFLATGTNTDDIDYNLLSRDRSQCTPKELEHIRRERNRMHAKRTRDRKRLFVFKLEEICHQLETENALLHQHLKKVDPNYEPPPPSPPKMVSLPTSPKLQSNSKTIKPSPASNMAVLDLHEGEGGAISAPSQGTKRSLGDDAAVTNDIATLLRVARRTLDLHEISDAADEEDDDVAVVVSPLKKRQRTAKHWFVV